MNDIKILLCLGEEECDEKGKRTFSAGRSSSVSLKAMDISKASHYRDELHNLLDKAIDSVDAQVEIKNHE